MANVFSPIRPPTAHQYRIVSKGQDERQLTHDCIAACMAIAEKIDPPDFRVESDVEVD